MGRKNKNEIELTESEFRKQVTLTCLNYSISLCQEINNAIINNYFNEGLTAKKTLENIRDLIYNKIDQAQYIINNLTGQKNEKEEKENPATKTN